MVAVVGTIAISLLVRTSSALCNPIPTPHVNPSSFGGIRLHDRGFVYSATVASGGASAGGVNAGPGMTVKIGEKGWKFFTEVRYTYAWSRGLASIPAALVPVTFEIRFN